MKEEYNYKIKTVRYQLVTDFTKRSWIEKQLMIFTIEDEKTKEEYVLYYTDATIANSRKIRDYPPSQEEVDEDHKIAVEKMNLVRQIKEMKFKDIEETREYIYKILVMVYCT